jgi:arylsulfatase A-like enzyme
MRHITFIILSVLASVLGMAPVARCAERPNIILIMSDDIGIGGFSCYGSDNFKTPHLDALATGGVRFEHCFSMALCGPSRACLLTGRYAFRTGMVSNGTGKLVSPEKEVCIAKALKGVGYATAFAGKWNQLGYLQSAEEAKRWGWDEYLRWERSDQDGRYWNPHYDKNGKFLEGVEKGYGPDLCHDFAVDFISRHKDKPFFLYYPTPLVHGPILRTPDSAPEKAKAEEPKEEKAKAGKKGKKAKTRNRGLLGDNVTYLDKIIGKLAAELDRQKLREKTVILFTSDNGTPGEDTIGGKVIDGRKGSLKEGGTRVPLIVNWKGTIAGGQVCKDLVDFSDFFPTLIELAGAKPPEGVTLDGQTFAPQLQGKSGKPREWVQVQLQGNRYVRDARWKLYSDGTLCDMKDAPFAEHTIAKGTEDETAAAARRRLQAALDKLK